MASEIEEWQAVDWSEGLPLRSGPLFWGLVDASPNTEPFWTMLKKEGEVHLRRCTECGTWQHPRQVVCQTCYATDLVSERASGRGTVYSMTTIEYPNHEDLKSVVPYSLGIIALEEAVPLFARIVSAADETGRSVSIGDVGTCTGHSFLGLTLPLFRAD